MKLTMIMITLVSACVLLGGAALPESSTDNTASGDTVTYEVFGMDCPGCHGGLEKNVLKVDGVTEVVANWKEKTVTLVVESEEAVSEEAILRAVKDSNFTLGKRIQ